jgi:hypothetical protein
MVRGSTAILLGLGLVATSAAAGWLYVENGRLENDLAAARAKPAEVVTVEKTVEAPPASENDRRRGGALGRIFGGGPPPAIDAGPGGPPRDEDWRARRARRQERMRDFLGRGEGETDEAYRARMSPLVEGALAVPRGWAEEARADWEAAAELDEEQRAAVDAAFADARAEALAAANAMIASGELSPYKRSSRGVLAFAAGAATIADGVDARLRGVLSAEQMAAAEEAGFDWLEYLALTTKWEGLNPPPPAP